MAYRKRRATLNPVPQTRAAQTKYILSHKVDNTYTFDFPTTEAFLESFISKGINPEANASRTDYRGCEEFYGGSYEQAVQWLQTGDSKTAQKLKERYNVVMAQGVKTFRPEYVFADSGLFFDVSTYLSGEPEYWLQEQASSTVMDAPKEIIKIYINLRTGADQTSEDYLRRGAHVVMLVETLEQAGLTVELVGVCANRSDNFKTSVVTNIVLKQAGQALDFDKIAFSLCNVSFWRRLYFAYKEWLPLELREMLGVKINGGYGIVDEPNYTDGIYFSSEAQITNETIKSILREKGIEVE